MASVSVYTTDCITGLSSTKGTVKVPALSMWYTAENLFEPPRLTLLLLGRTSRLFEAEMAAHTPSGAFIFVESCSIFAAGLSEDESKKASWTLPPSQNVPKGVDKRSVCPSGAGDPK